MSKARDKKVKTKKKVKDKVTKPQGDVNFKDFINIYEFDCVLPGSGQKVKFRPLTTFQLKKLLAHENETSPVVVDRALDSVISSSVLSEDFNINDLYLQDRFFLMIEIRKATKGTKYEFTYDCPKCKSQRFQVIDLDDLKITPYEEKENVVKIDNNITLMLENVKRKDQIEAYDHMPKNKLSDIQEAVELTILTYACSIKEIVLPNSVVQTDLSIPDKKYIVENISTHGYEKIKDWHNENNFGIEFKFKLNCNCGHKEKLDIPVTDVFF